MSRAFSERQEADIRRMLRHAEDETGLRFSVYVGRGDGEARKYAHRVHAALGAESGRTVLIFVDPLGRALEIVTGEQARRRLDDRACGLAAMSMATAFSIGDLTDGICDGVNLLREQARRPPIEHEHDLD